MKALLTGVNGFIGSHILDSLLSHDIEVRGVVRSAEKGAQVRRDFPSAGARLDLAVVPDITVAGAYNEALATDTSIDVVIHTASPLSYATGKTLDDFVKPAVRGTLEILEATAKHAPNVRRLIITGSFAAIGNPKDMQGNGKLYTSNDWNPVTVDDAAGSNIRLAYWYSKTMAERAAWDYMQQHRPHFEMVVLTPPMVYGPLRHTISSVEGLNVSNNNIWRDFVNSTEDAPIPAEWVHADIDVRDLAEAHFKAINAPKAGNKRYLVTRGRISNQEIADILREGFPELAHKIPRGTPGCSSLPAKAFDVDGRDAVEDLELNFRSPRETFCDLVKQIVDITSSQE